MAPAPEVAPEPRGGAAEEEAAVRILFAPRVLAPLAPDVAADPSCYRRWVVERETERSNEVPAGTAGSSSAPIVTVLTVLDEARRRHLAPFVDHLTAQRSAQWRLVVAAVGAVERTDAADDQRVQVVDVPPGTSEGSALAAAFGRVAASGHLADQADGVMVLDLTDRLAPDALFLLGRALATAGVAYADEDTLDEAGVVSDPRLKPQWSPDFLLSGPYLGRPTAMRRAVVERAGGICPVPGGDWEHDLQLRATEQAEPDGEGVVHVAEVLCHRAPRPSLDHGESAAAVARALARRHEVAEVGPGPVPGSVRVLRRPDRPYSVSVVIPFRDGAQFVRTCTDSVLAAWGDADLELVLVDNGSVEPETHSLLERLVEDPRVSVVHDPRPFNWAALNNAAVRQARGEVLLFLNDDVEATGPEWLGRLVAHALRPQVAAAGARLVYPDRRVQHVGIVPGMGGAAAHVLAGLKGDAAGYLGLAVLTHECSAVTGACLATRREVFELLGGFDETFGVDLNDVDYCLRARQLGLRVVIDPGVELIHHESPTRGTSGSLPDIRRFIDRWEATLIQDDPYLNPHLTRVECSCALRRPGEGAWWHQWRSTL